MSIPGGICVVDGELHIGMNKGEFVRVYLCCTQKKLERVLNEGLLFVAQSGRERDTHKGMEVDRKIRRGVQSETEICILWRNAGVCWCERTCET